MTARSTRAGGIHAVVPDVLARCLSRAPGGHGEARIVIRAIGGSADRPEGVSLETLNLFPTPWPPPPPGPDDLRAAVHVVGGAREKVAHADPLVLDVQNRGSTAWVDAAAEPDWSGNAALELRWRRLPSGPEDRSQRLRLPRVLHPGRRGAGGGAARPTTARSTASVPGTSPSCRSRPQERRLRLKPRPPSASARRRPMARSDGRPCVSASRP